MNGKEITKLTPAEKLKSVGIAYIYKIIQFSRHDGRRKFTYGRLYKR